MEDCFILLLTSHTIEYRMNTKPIVVCRLPGNNMFTISFHL